MMNRTELLKILAEHRTDEVVVFTQGAMHEWTDISPSPLNFVCSLAMGYASSVALGIALARPDKKVIVLDGDGSLLMNLGTLVTISNQSPSNLIYFVLDNGLYELPGQVPLPAADKISLADFARGAGLTKVYQFDSLQELREKAPAIMHEPGPIFIDVKVAPMHREILRVPIEFDFARQTEEALRAEQATVVSPMRRAE
ncbi:MAG: thiamine pyrophosphate-dependent enzyme [Dehalococcoidia bacterium]|nr:thiamine pyrophosphate-dependent enzyme [Dehalococcoidia bacterium]